MSDSDRHMHHLNGHTCHAKCIRPHCDPHSPCTWDECSPDNRCPTWKPPRSAPSEMSCDESTSHMPSTGPCHRDSPQMPSWHSSDATSRCSSIPTYRAPRDDRYRHLVRQPAGTTWLAIVLALATALAIALPILFFRVVT